MTCDVVIVSYCSSAQLPTCLDAVERNVEDLKDCRVFVVDNASIDHSVKCVHDSYPWATLIENAENVGYGAAINRALEQSEAQYVLCMNPDVRLRPGAISALLDCMNRHPNAIAAAPRLMYPDGSFHPVCRRFPSIWRNFCHVSGLAARLPEDSPSRHWLSKAQHDGERDVDMVSGACVLFRRDYLDRIGRFDENIFLYEEESDVFLPTRMTDETAYYCPDAKAIHEHGETSGDSQDKKQSFHRLRSKYYIYRKHFGESVGRLTYWTDSCVFGFSTVRHRFTIRYRARRAQQALARKAYEQAVSHTR